ncbi:MAG: NUDIX hydrolase [Candidatus Saccharimonadales bacterium]
MSKLRVLARKQVFDHPWERIFIEKVETENGKTFNYLISEPNDFVIVVPFVGAEKLLMVEQYKHGAQKYLLGFPAGFINKGESPEDCAKRELHEEVHYTAETFRLVATLSENPTRCRNSYYIIFAENARPTAAKQHTNPDDLEGDITTQLIKRADLLRPDILQKIKAGPMLSAIPFIMGERL